MSTCDCAHCGIGECANFYIEDGVRHCLRGHTPVSGGNFRASRAQSTVMDTLTLQIEEVLRLMKTYVGVCEQSKQAHKKWRQSELNLLKIRVARLSGIIELRRMLQARRLQLTMEHPYGWMTDLGYPLSDAALESMHRATRMPDFADPSSFITTVNNQESLLANPQKLAALRLAES